MPQEPNSTPGAACRAGVFLALAFACAVSGAHAEPAEPEARKRAAPSAAALTTARELVVTNGLSRSFATLIPQFMDQITRHLTQTRPELHADLDAVMKELKPEFERQADEMITIAARAYAEHLSEADLDAAVAFFKSPTGGRYIAAQPTILTEIVTAMQGWQGKIPTEMMARVRAEMKKRGHEL